MKIDVLADAEAVAREAARFIAAEKLDLGMAICGSGVGASVCAFQSLLYWKTGKPCQQIAIPCSPRTRKPLTQGQ